MSTAMEGRRSLPIDLKLQEPEQGPREERFAPAIRSNL